MSDMMSDTIERRRSSGRIPAVRLKRNAVGMTPESRRTTRSCG